MNIGILSEPGHDLRVVMIPETVSQLVKLNTQVMIESGAGSKAFFSDNDYTNAGAKVVSKKEILSGCQVVMRINAIDEDDLALMPEKTVVLNVFQPLSNPKMVASLLSKNLSSFSLDMIPRTTRAQAMDILSSQATAAGYKAVLTAATCLPKFFPMFMTAAGSITPAKVLILGAGVAGLQAIATARRLGAVVEVFDTRAAVKEEVKSLGAKFIEVEGAADSAAAGGYAVEQSKDFQEKQKQKIHESAVKSDVIISTAQIPGRKAPVLITRTTVESMKPGSVIVDLAASTGGNCEVTQNNQTILHNGVSVIGNSNLPSTLQADASKMFGKNVFNFLKLIIAKDGALFLNFEDDIVKGSCITHEKEIIHSRVKESVAVTG